MTTTNPVRCYACTLGLRTLAALTPAEQLRALPIPAADDCAGCRAANGSRTCRACPAILTTACAWCPNCQAARLDADRQRVQAAPREPRVRVDRHGRRLRSQVNWCR